MEVELTRAQFEAAAAAIRARTPQQPRIGLVLGSGLGSLAEAVGQADSIPASDIPHWPGSTVKLIPLRVSTPGT